jgi:hypothetical protein
MSHISLIEYTTEEVNYDGNSSNNGKDCPWTDRLLCRLSSNTSSCGENLEVIGALIRICANERRCRSGCERVFVAMERDQS